jgi:hypothetical protein
VLECMHGMAKHDKTVTNSYTKDETVVICGTRRVKVPHYSALHNNNKTHRAVLQTIKSIGGKCCKCLHSATSSMCSCTLRIVLFHA